MCARYGRKKARFRGLGCCGFCLGACIILGIIRTRDRDRAHAFGQFGDSVAQLEGNADFATIQSRLDGLKVVVAADTESELAGAVAAGIAFLFLVLGEWAMIFKFRPAQAVST